MYAHARVFVYLCPHTRVCLGGTPSVCAHLDVWRSFTEGCSMHVLGVSVCVSVDVSVSVFLFSSKTPSPGLLP